MKEKFLVVFGKKIDKNGMDIEASDPIVVLSENITGKENELIEKSKKMIKTNGREWFTVRSSEPIGKTKKELGLRVGKN